MLQESCDRSLRFDIVLPGSEIPEWFRFRSGGPSIKTRLYSNWCRSEWMGFAVCVLLPAKTSSYNFYCRIRACGTDLDASAKCINTDYMGISLQGDHLWQFYLPRHFFPQEWLENSYDVIEFSFSDQFRGFLCGLRLVYKEYIIAIDESQHGSKR